MKIFFETRAKKEKVEAHLFIGEEDGHLVCLLREEEGLRSSTTHLLSRNSYEIWRSYMSELARLEKENWSFERRDLPRTGEVSNLHKEYSL